MAPFLFLSGMQDRFLALPLTLENRPSGPKTYSLMNSPVYAAFWPSKTSIWTVLTLQLNALVVVQFVAWIEKAKKRRFSTPQNKDLVHRCLSTISQTDGGVRPIKILFDMMREDLKRLILRRADLPRDSLQQCHVSEQSLVSGKAAFF